MARFATAIRAMPPPTMHRCLGTALRRTKLAYHASPRRFSGTSFGHSIPDVRMAHAIVERDSRCGGRDTLCGVRAEVHIYQLHSIHDVRMAHAIAERDSRCSGRETLCSVSLETGIHRCHGHATHCHQDLRAQGRTKMRTRAPPLVLQPVPHGLKLQAARLPLSISADRRPIRFSRPAAMTGGGGSSATIPVCPA